MIVIKNVDRERYTVVIGYADLEDYRALMRQVVERNLAVLWRFP